MAKFLLGLLSLVGLTSHELEVHAIYISTLELSPGDRVGECLLLVRVFQDDLQDAMRLAYGKNEALTGHSSEVTKRNLEMYLQEQISISINGGDRTLELVNIEEVNDIYKMNMTVRAPKPWFEIHMDVRLLLELFPTQNNIVTIKNDDKKKQYRLHGNNKSLYWKRE